MALDNAYVVGFCRKGYKPLGDVKTGYITPSQVTTYYSKKDFAPSSFRESFKISNVHEIRPCSTVYLNNCNVSNSNFQRARKHSINITLKH